MNMTLQQDYWHDKELKQKFINFLIHIHRLDLSLWDELGYWDDNFHPFSLFDGDKLVSSLCLYSMDMIVDGKRTRVAQISSVGTLEDYRRQGLNRQLHERAIEWAEPTHDFFFLFADTEAVPFYKKCGFRSTLEHKASITASPAKFTPGAEKLNPEIPEHRDRIYRMACRRTAVSDLLGVFNEKLLMFWCLYYLKDNIYYIADLDLLVLYARENGVLTVFDILGKNIPPFDNIYPYIRNEADKSVEFIFMTDKLNLKTPVRFAPLKTNLTHLMGRFPLETTNFAFPYTCYA